MAGNALILPEKPSEYLHDNYELVPTGYKWVFGLPAEGQISSATCGAMPFRHGTGLASPNCIRGEDWIFMHNWVVDRNKFPVWYMFPDFYGWQGVIYKQPRLEQLSAMYSNLSSLADVWGTSFSFSNQQCSYDAAESILKSGLQILGHGSLESTMPPLTGNVPLSRSRIETYFKDMRKFKCTFTQADHDSPGTHMQQEIYYYSCDKRSEGPADVYEQEYYLSSMNVNAGYYVADENQRPLQLDAMFIGLFYASMRSNDDDPAQEGYCLYQLSDKVTITQNLRSDSYGRQFSYPCHLGGSSLAGEIAGILGMNIHPNPPDTHRAYFSCIIKYLYCVVWPSYLTW